VTLKVLELLLGILIGVLSTIVATYVVLFLRKPNLTAYPLEEDPKKGVRILYPYYPIMSRYIIIRHAFYHVNTKNKKRRFKVFPVLPAQNAKVTIVFERDGKEVLKIPAKWDSRPEPLDGYPPKRVVPELITQSEVTDVNPGTEESFPVCLKHEGDDGIYGFNAFSYLHPYGINPNWRLGKGEIVYA